MFLNSCIANVVISKFVGLFHYVPVYFSALNMLMPAHLFLLFLSLQDFLFMFKVFPHPFAVIFS